MHYLITGGTGFVGRYVIAALLRRDGDARVTALVRRHRRYAPEARVRRALEAVGAADLLPRVEALAGDLAATRFGLDQPTYDALARRTGRLIHGAASVRFDQSIEEARRNNTRTTEEVLRFAHAAGLERLDHVSTCYVAGRRTDLVREDELEHDAGFKNGYEQSKYESEQLLRREAGSTALTVMRPSIVVGDSRTGATTSFNVIYWPMKLYHRGWWRTVIGRRETTVDAVPVDFVGEAIAALALRPEAAGRTFHLAAGPARQSTAAEIADLTRRLLDGPPVRWIDPDTFTRWVQPVLDPLLLTRRLRRIRRGGHIYLPYFTANPSFDTTHADAALAPLGIEPLPVREYFENLVRFAVDSDFGRH